jgi:hypothetical protein
MWRTGSKVKVNVYDGDRVVCQCQTAEYAALIVKAVNFLQEHQDMLATREKEIEEGK